MQALDDIALLTQAARRAGDIARPFWKADPKAWDKGGNAGPVTEADLAVDEMLHDFLISARPDHGWLSEETKDTDARLSADCTFIVDPIDGTRSFIAGDNNWAHSIAIAEHGRIKTAVVFLPVRDRMFVAHEGQGATLNGEPLHVSATESANGATLLTAKPNLDEKHWPRGRPDFVHHSRPSLAYRMALIAQGRFDAMLSLPNTWEWDVAAGTLLVTEAGGTVTDRHGTPPKFNKPHPGFQGLIAANSKLRGEIYEHLKP